MKLCLLASLSVGEALVPDRENVIQFQVIDRKDCLINALIVSEIFRNSTFKISANPCFQAYDADETDNVVFEARFKKRLYPEGYTFDEVKAYCDDLGDGYQVPVPKNLHQNKALMELYSQGEHKLY